MTTTKSPGNKASQKKLLTIGVIVGLFALFWIGVARYLTLADIQRIGKQAGRIAEDNPIAIFGVLALLQSIGMALSLPTKAIFTLLAGALLGTLWGSLATFVGVLSGTTVLFFATRRWLREMVSRKLGAKAKEIESRISSRPIRALIGLRLFITLPFGPITLAAALSRMTFRDFIIGTMIGDIPVIVAYTVAARQLFTLSRVSDALSPWTVGILVGAGLFILTTAVLGRRRTVAASKPV